MLWILQYNFVDKMTSKLAWGLRRNGKTIHDIALDEGEPLVVDPAWAQEPCFFYGSAGFLQRLRKTEFADSLWDVPIDQDQRNWVSTFGDVMLNNECDFVTYSDFKTKYARGSWFVRPVLHQKAFTGQVVTNGDVFALEVNRKGRYVQHPPDILVAVSPVAPRIRSEYRLWLYKGLPVMGCRYRDDGAPSRTADAPPEILRTAAELVRGKVRSDLIVMDVAVTENGELKIVEFNSVHSAGIYDLNADELIELVEIATRERTAAKLAPSS
jgi:hypothetical protein